jgi:hypothetical protein
VQGLRKTRKKCPLNRWKEIVKIRAEIKDTETKCTIKINHQELTLYKYKQDRNAQGKVKPSQKK